MGAFVAVQLLIVVATFSDPDGRYLLYIFPFLMVFAARGAVAIGRFRISSAHA